MTTRPLHKWRPLNPASEAFGLSAGWQTADRRFSIVRLPRYDAFGEWEPRWEVYDCQRCDVIEYFDRLRDALAWIETGGPAEEQS